MTGAAAAWPRRSRGGARLGAGQRLPRRSSPGPSAETTDMRARQRAARLRVPRRQRHDGRAAPAQGARMRRLPATTVYYGLELLLSTPTFVVVAVYLVKRPRSLAAPARADGDGDGGDRLPVRGADRRRRRYVQPAAVADHRISRHGHGLAARRSRLSGVARRSRSGRSGVLRTRLRAAPTQAWITDEVGVDERRRRSSCAAPASRTSARSSASSLWSPWARNPLRAAVIAGGAVQIVSALACIFLMPETGFRRRPRGRAEGSAHGAAHDSAARPRATFARRRSC